MVYSSHPLYQLDPPDWQYHQHHQQQQQQQMILYGVGNEIINSNNTPQHPPLQPLAAAMSGSRNIRPGSMTDRARMAKVPLPETSLKCPRCESTNTKFCYFNNYSLTQPRHFCKTCRRYWTRGGALRNVPVGGGCRRATKRRGKKRSKSPAISSGTATATTTTTSTDHQNSNNMIDDGIPQFPLLYPHGSLNQMVHEFGDHYIGGGNNNNNNNYGGSYTDPHIARLFQTGVISLTDSSTDHHHQWNKLGMTTTLTHMHSPPFPFLTNFAPQEHYSSQPSGQGYQFNQCSGQLGLTESSQVEAPAMDQTVAVTNVKMENGERGLKRFLELRALESSHTSMASGNGQFSMVGNRNGNTWTDVIGFTSNDEQTTCQNSL